MAKTSMKSTALESRTYHFMNLRCGYLAWTIDHALQFTRDLRGAGYRFFTDNAFVCFPVDAAGHSR